MLPTAACKKANSIGIAPNNGSVYGSEWVVFLLKLSKICIRRKKQQKVRYRSRYDDVNLNFKLKFVCKKEVSFVDSRSHSFLTSKVQFTST